MTDGRPTILVVEDDPELRTFYRAALIVGGYVVRAVGDGVEALRQIEVDEPDLVVLDLGLPCLHGRDVYTEIRSHAEWRKVPIVVVTGEDNPNLRLAEFDCLLAKPVDAHKLAEVVRDCL